jgi:uncharacterized protein
MSCRRFLGRLGHVVVCSATLMLAGSTGAWSEIKLNDGTASYSLQVMSYRDIPFRTVVRQQYDYSCGSAALATLLRYHYGQQQIGEAEIFKAMYEAGDQAKIQMAGFSLLDMKQYLNRAGYEADGYRMSMDELAKSDNPAIAVITVGPYRHFVVVKGMDNNMVLVGDPALGLKKYPRADFEKMWNNNIIFMIHGGKATKGAFNRAEEWRPFNPAPIAQIVDTQTLFRVTTQLPTIFQVQQLTPLVPD